MNKTKRISEIVDQMIEDTGLSNRGLAREINDCMDSENAISYQAVRNWRLGMNKPLPFLFEILCQRAEDKRMQRFALDILEVLKPEDFRQPVS